MLSMEDSLDPQKPGSDPPKEAQALEWQIRALTIVKVVLVLVGLYLVYVLRDVVVMLFVALILASLIDPAADWFERRKIPRAVGVLAIYVVLFGIIGGAIVLIVPPLLGELRELILNFASIWERAAGGLASVQEFSVQYGIAENIERGLRSLEEGLYRAVSSALGTIRGFFGGIISFLLVLVLTFYMVVEEDALKRLFRSIAPPEYHSYLSGLFGRMQKKIGQWLRGELILMFIVGFFSYIGLLILKVDYALILALIAGFAEIIPYAGPIIAAVPAVILAATQSPLKALFVVVLYFVIQQLENNLLVPKVMQRAIGLNPVVSIVALLIGARLGGVLGAVLAIPVATAVSVFAQDLLSKREKTV